MTFEQIRASLLTRPRDAIALTLSGEAAGEPMLGRVAVACVIHNRAVKPGWWGRTDAGVCLAKDQFSCWWETRTPNSLRLYALAERLLSNTLAPSDTAALDPLWAIAVSVLSGVTPDVTNGATHYLTNALFSTAPPPWAKGRTPCAVVGRHCFFKDVP
jgi:hypothetical protein